MDSAAVNASHLRSFIERIEKLEEEKRAIADDIKDVYAEAKGTGFDAKIIRKIVSCAAWTATSAARRKRFWISTSRRSAWWISLSSLHLFSPYAGRRCQKGR